jgi:hypothetical protein
MVMASVKIPMSSEKKTSGVKNGFHSSDIRPRLSVLARISSWQQPNGILKKHRNPEQSKLSQCVRMK